MQGAHRIPLFIGTYVSMAVSLAVACGGPEAKEPGSSSGGSGPSSAASASPGSASTTPAAGTGGDNGGTTTTTQIDASDLQGARLGSSSHVEIETKGDAGPKGGKSDEPGRRREDIKTIIMAHRDDARACYDKGLKDHPGIEGNLDIKWTIDPDGNVTNIAVDDAKSAIHEPTVGACVMDVIKKIKFAASQKGFETHANYPFDFHPKPGRRDGGA